MGSADISQFVVTTADGTACEISTLKVRALFPHLPATFTGTSSNFWASSLLADLPVFPSLVCGSCSSGQGFAYSFLQIPPHDGHPCCSAIHFPLPRHVQDFHLRERAHGAKTKRAPKGAPQIKRQALGLSKALRLAVFSSLFSGHAFQLLRLSGFRPCFGSFSRRFSYNQLRLHDTILRLFLLLDHSEQHTDRRL